MLRHARLMIDFKGEFTGIHEMRKHVAWYSAGMYDSSRLRNLINQVESYDEMVELLDAWTDGMLLEVMYESAGVFLGADWFYM